MKYRYLLMLYVLLFHVIVILGFGFGIIQLDFDKVAFRTDSDTSGDGEDDFVYQAGVKEDPKNALSMDKYTLDEIENISVYEKYNRAVINISTEVMAYNWFLEAIPRKGSSGSGSIIDTRGYVLTNNHVVENAYKVNVTLSDGATFEGEVIGSDPENDLAVVKFDPGKHEMITIPFGESDDLRIGQKVLAIGNPFAFERTLTTGIISGLGRPLQNDKGLIIQNLIQTDASINPGNSGGPLLNSQGQLIGVNTMIYTPSGGSVGIGFAVPVDTARRVVPDLIKFGYVKRGWIEVETVQLFPSLVRYAKLSTSRGLLVSSVKKNGNADIAGIRGGNRSQTVRSGKKLIYLGGDIIVGINDEEIATLGDFYATLENTNPGDVMRVRLLRGKKELEVKVVLAERDGN